MACRVDFYHLLEDRVERVLPRLCEKLLANGEKLVVTAGEDQIDRLDALLWTWSAESFLPHGREGADQPILLTTEAQPANGANTIALADGVWREEALAFDRILFLFDETQRAAARETWCGLKGVETHYWKRGDKGHWADGV